MNCPISSLVFKELVPTVHNLGNSIFINKSRWGNIPYLNEKQGIWYICRKNKEEQPRTETGKFTVKDNMTSTDDVEEDKLSFSIEEVNEKTAKKLGCLPKNHEGGM